MKDNDRLHHMLEMSRTIISLTENRQKEDIYTDNTLLMALTYALIIIGEAAAQISGEYKQKHPDILWRQISGMRNRLINGYFATNPEIVWETVSVSIPELIAKLEAMTGQTDDNA